MKKDLESYEQLTLGRVIGFDCFGLDDHRSVATLKVLAFVGDGSGNVARGQAETCT